LKAIGRYYGLRVTDIREQHGWIAMAGIEIDVTAEMVAAFKAKDRDALRRILHLKPWELDPLQVDDGPYPGAQGTPAARSWPKAQMLRRKLLEA
jgi:hypothetical protein